jgi:hypothetical protein
MLRPGMILEATGACAIFPAKKDHYSVQGSLVIVTEGLGMLDTIWWRDIADQSDG